MPLSGRTAYMRVSPGMSTRSLPDDGADARTLCKREDAVAVPEGNASIFYQVYAVATR